MMKVKTSKGFTLAELLIVMAIIVVLAAIAIPTFGKQLETAREANDAEAIRAVITDAFTQAYTDYASKGTAGIEANGYPFDGTNHGVDVTFTQKVAGFQYVRPTYTVGTSSVATRSTTVPAVTGAAETVTVKFEEDAANSTIKLSDILIGTSTISGG